MKEQAPVIAKERGFTIVELLIAMAVVSVILLLASIMITSIGSLYYKGISQSKAQDNVRAVIDEVSQHLQLTDSPPTPASYFTFRAYCVDTTRYTYILGKQLSATPGVGQSKHVLWRDTVPAGTCTDPAPPNSLPNLNMLTPSATGKELMAPRTRLTNFVLSATSPYSVIVNIAFGDTDLLCDGGTPGDCNNPVASTHIWSPLPPAAFPAPGNDIRCKGSKVTTSQRFCGTANLTTTVVQRLH